MTSVLEKIVRYRDYTDDQERHLYYFYVGYKCALERGYKESFAELLGKNIEIEDINSFLKGYEEAS